MSTATEILGLFGLFGLFGRSALVVGREAGGEDR